MDMNEAAARLDLDPARLNYLVHIDDKRRIAYFETPKVACTSIKKFMQDVYSGGEMVLDRPGQVHDRRKSPLRTLREISDPKRRSVVVGTFRRFAFFRNPYTRTLSAYLDKIVTNEWERRRHLPKLGFEPDERPSFEDFLERVADMSDEERDIHYSLQSELVPLKLAKFTFLGSFERFAEDFQRLKTELFDQTDQRDYADFGKHHETGAGDKLDEYYSARETNLVRKIYLRDFRRLGYSVSLKDAHLPPDGLGKFLSA